MLLANITSLLCFCVCLLLNLAIRTTFNWRLCSRGVAIRSGCVCRVLRRVPRRIYLRLHHHHLRCHLAIFVATANLLLLLLDTLVLDWIWILSLASVLLFLTLFYFVGRLYVLILIWIGHIATCRYARVLVYLGCCS